MMRRAFWKVDSHLNYSRLNYCSFELLLIWTTDMKSYPVVQINTLLAHLNYLKKKIYNSWSIGQWSYN